MSESVSAESFLHDGVYRCIMKPSFYDKRSDMGREFELKFAATPQQQALIRQSFGDFETVTMETVYYDTPEGDFSQRHITLRRRLENGVSVCTVKTPACDGSRGEWECRCVDIRKAVPELCRLGAPEELVQWCSGPLVETCGARFTRQLKTVAAGDAVAELALDSGVLLGGGKEMPLCEVEVEQKSGSDEAVAAFARQLAAEFGLKPEERSKLSRAMTLAKED